MVYYIKFRSCEILQTLNFYSRQFLYTVVRLLVIIVYLLVFIVSFCLQYFSTASNLHNKLAEKRHANASCSNYAKSACA